MIDTHCHIDLYKNPIEIAIESENARIITIGMTNLPSHFELGYQHLRSFKHVRLALGMHPLYANEHMKELPSFINNLPRTSYIGEIGLDFSKEGIATKDIQLQSFSMILTELRNSHKILSLHSRKAEREVLHLLGTNNIKSAIFHWYSGPAYLIDEIISAGYYFSINPAMVNSKSGQEIIKRIPLEFLLTESDGPFVEINNRQIRPSDVEIVLKYLSNFHNLAVRNIENQIARNFKRLIDLINKK